MQEKPPVEIHGGFFYLPMRRIYIFFMMLAAFGAARAQFDVHGGYSMVIERASKTTILMHGGHIEAGYNFKLVENLGLRTGLALQMTMMTQNTVTELRTGQTQSQAKAVVTDPGFQEYDVFVPAHVNYTFDPASQLHFTVFAGPSIGLTFGEMKGINFTDAYYKDAAYHRVGAVNMALDMGLEFRFRQFGLRLAFNREMLTSGHRFTGKHRIKRDMLTLGVAYHFEKYEKTEK